MSLKLTCRELDTSLEGAITDQGELCLREGAITRRMVLSKDGFSTVSEKTGQPHVSARCGPHEGFIVDEGIRLLVDGRT